MRLAKWERRVYKLDSLRKTHNVSWQTERRVARSGKIEVVRRGPVNPETINRRYFNKEVGCARITKSGETTRRIHFKV